MAFRLYSTDDGHVPAWEYYESTAIQPQVGQGMAFNSSGQLVVSATPEFICMREEDAAVEAGTKIPVVRINDNQVWETVLYSDANAAKVGVLADVDPSGRWVTAEEITNQNFHITYIEGNTMASPLRGRFVK